MAKTFWDSPAMVLEDAVGHTLDTTAVASGQAMPARLRVRVANRGEQPARDIVLTTWWAPLGAAHPLPRPETGGGAWQTGGFGIEGQAGNLQHVAEIAPSGLVEWVFDWVPPLDANGTVIPHLLLATAGAADDPFDPADTICAQNNAAMLCIAAGRDGVSVPFQILGSEDTDGLIFWCDDPNARLRIENMPVTALPWRDAEMFQTYGRKTRQLYGAVDALDDIAVRLTVRLDGPELVEQITDLQGATSLELQDGHVMIDAGAKLTIARQSGCEPRVNQDEKRRPGEAMIVAGGRLGKV